jgi:hypothetical protein
VYISQAFCRQKKGVSFNVASDAEKGLVPTVIHWPESWENKLLERPAVTGFLRLKKLIRHRFSCLSFCWELLDDFI